MATKGLSPLRDCEDFEIGIMLEDGFLPDRYGKHSRPEQRCGSDNVCSFPFTVEGAPEGTESFALVFSDYDSIPVCGFAWIHWVVANLPADFSGLPDDAAWSGAVPGIKGKNSTWSRYAEMVDEIGEDAADRVLHGYLGPCPPDKDHVYTLRVYALDAVLDLDDGFFLNELHWKMEGHVLAVAEADFASRA